MLMLMSGKLYIVGTPIGNLEDISARAIRVLSECDTVLCEDTRVTKKLLHHYHIEKPTISYHAHSGDSKYEKIRNLLEEGRTLALVSDAGTPTISDPGAMLVKVVRERMPEVKIESVPGPSAVTTALSIAGVPSDTFTFLGFPPHKKGRETFFSTVAAVEHTVVFYESPHRIMKALSSLNEKIGEGKRVTVVREMTKLYEEVVAGTAGEVLEHFTQHGDTVRGEFVIIVSPT